MDFREKLNLARNKRIAHTDLDSQVIRLEAMGRFEKGEDAQFFAELQSFFDAAYRHVHGSSSAPDIRVGGSSDSHKVIRAIKKATLYDRCPRCTEDERAINALDFEDR